MITQDVGTNPSFTFNEQEIIQHILLRIILYPIKIQILLVSELLNRKI